MDIKRGEVYLADLTDMTEKGTHLMKGKRPVLIVQNDIGNKHAPTTVVAVISASISKSYPMHQKVELDRKSVVMFEQLFTIDKDRLEGKIGELSDGEIKTANDKLCLSLGLSKRDLGNIVAIEIQSKRTIETKRGKSTEVKIKVQFKNREVKMNLPLTDIQEEFGVADDVGLVQLEEVIDSVDGVRFIGERLRG